MLQENLQAKHELKVLIRELDSISSDLSQYLNFLVERRHLIEQVMTEGLSSHN